MHFGNFTVNFNYFGEAKHFTPALLVPGRHVLDQMFFHDQSHGSDDCQAGAGAIL
jgi:hypothetical protein